MRWFVHYGHAVALAIVLAGSPALAAPARTVLYGGTIFTGDPAAPWAQAIALEDDRVVAVGSDAEVLGQLAPHTTRIDLAGRLVVPGLNDAHVHVVVPEGDYLNTPDFLPGPGPTLAEVQALLAGAAPAPADAWLFAFIGSNVFDDPAATRVALDAASVQHPVALFAWTGHGIWLNTAAMAALGISPTEPDPFGGTFRRFPGSNVITGEAHEYAEFAIRRRLLALLPDAHLVAQYRAFASTAVQLGYTSLQDMAVGLTQRRALDALRAADLPLRVRSICFPLAPAERCEVDDADEHGRVRAAGVKWIVDGTPVERLAFVTTPYADRLGQVGAPDLRAQDLRAQLTAHRRGSARGHQLLFHSVGDAAIDQIFTAMEDTGGAHVWQGRRTRIEHGDLLFPGDFARARSLGVVVVQNPTHFALAPVFAQRFIPAVFANLEPLRSLLAAGIPLALGTDGIGAPQSPFLNIFLATIHPTRPAEALTVTQALSAFTLGAAYAELEDHRKGTLRPGRLADLAVLSQDIFHVAPTAIPATTSVLTVVGGRVVWDAGVLHATAAP